VPGIAGIISQRPSVENGRVIEQMVRSMSHESTYTSGTYSNESMRLWAGWVSHGGSFSDCLPAWNEAHDICLIFSGEHFADPGETRSLQAGSQRLREDASHLVRLYEKDGRRFFEKLNGFFCGLVLDLRERKILILNDRYGMGRIYFHTTSDGCYFASEAKALLKVLPHLRGLDPKSFGELVAVSCPLQNRSLFKDISLVPPASLWTVDVGGTLHKERYFDEQEWEDQPALPLEDYYEKLKATWAGVLPRYFRSNEKIAVSLTGGLDSRIIMAWFRGGPGSLPCYTHRGIFNECADARVARRVAETCHQPHQVIRVDEGFFADYRELAKQTVYLTDGAMDVSGAAGLYVNRIASREIAPIRMTGNYGGQILRGIVALNANKLRNPIFSRDFDTPIKEALATLSAEKNASRSTIIAFKQMPWYHYARYSLEHTQLSVRSPYVDNDLVALSYQMPKERFVNEKLAVRLIADGNPELIRFPTDRGPLGRPGLLGKVRREYQEFTFKADYAFDYGMPHWLTKVDRALSPLHLERLFLGRHKYYHYRYFYRHQLAPVVKEILLDPRALSRPYLHRTYVEKMVSDHLRGDGNYTTEIHTLLTAELIHQLLLEQ
jgi:asparagine synthase (glutamine-hydrolysing)